jgi:hypothetical protein
MKLRNLENESLLPLKLENDSSVNSKETENYTSKQETYLVSQNLLTLLWHEEKNHDDEQVYYEVYFEIKHISTKQKKEKKLFFLFFLFSRKLSV